MKLEFHAWPPRNTGGQQVGTGRGGILAVDADTGVAVVVRSERSQLSNQKRAEERLQALLDGSAQPGEWIP